MQAKTKMSLRVAHQLAPHKPAVAHPAAGMPTAIDLPAPSPQPCLLHTLDDGYAYVCCSYFFGEERVLFAEKVVRGQKYHCTSNSNEF